MRTNSVEPINGNEFNFSCKNAAALVALEVVPPNSPNAELLILLVRNKPEQRRARDTDLLMFPGGGIEAGESMVSASIRELKEETCLNIDLAQRQSYAIGNAMLYRQYNDFLRQTPPSRYPLAFIDNNKVGVTLILFENIKPPLAQFITSQTQPADDVAEVHWVRTTDIAISRNVSYPEMETPYGKIANANAHCIRLLVSYLQSTSQQHMRSRRLKLEKFSQQNPNLQRNGKVSLPLDQIPEQENLRNLWMAGIRV